MSGSDRRRPSTRKGPSLLSSLRMGGGWVGRIEEKEKRQNLVGLKGARRKEKTEVRMRGERRGER